MKDSIHAHQLIDLLKNKPMPESELGRYVEEKWGVEARFHTCSQQGLDLQALLQFLSKRQKVIEQDGILSVNMARVCNH